MFLDILENIYNKYKHVCVFTLQVTMYKIGRLCHFIQIKVLKKNSCKIVSFLYRLLYRNSVNCYFTCCALTGAPASRQTRTACIIIILIDNIIIICFIYIYIEIKIYILKQIENVSHSRLYIINSTCT